MLIGCCWSPATACTISSSTKESKGAGMVASLVLPVPKRPYSPTPQLNTSPGNNDRAS